MVDQENSIVSAQKFRKKQVVSGTKATLLNGLLYDN